MNWIRIRPSGGGGAPVELIKLCNYSMSLSSTSGNVVENIVDITPDPDFVLPFVPEAGFTYQLIGLNETTTGACSISSSKPKEDRIESVGTSVKFYVRLVLTAGGNDDIEVGSTACGSSYGSGAFTATCGTSDEITDGFDSLKTRVYADKVFTVLPDHTTYSRTGTCSGQLYIVKYMAT
jgi:hypothetical protein